MSRLSENMKSVKAEAKSMMETLEKVRGRHYAASVHCLLLIQQIAKLTGVMVTHLEEDHPDLAIASRQAMPEVLTQLGLAISKISNFSEEYWKQIVADVDKMDESMDRLANSAIDAANNGRGFGGEDAA